MVFTQGRGFVLGASFGLPSCFASLTSLGCHAADTASLATWLLFGKLIGVAMLVGFGEKRCRKNLPLDDLTNPERCPNQLSIHFGHLCCLPMTAIPAVRVTTIASRSRRTESAHGLFTTALTLRALRSPNLSPFVPILPSTLTL